MASIDTFNKPLAAVVAVLLALVAVPAAAEEAESIPVGVDGVRIEPLNQTIPVIGRLVPRQAGIVAAQTGGPVAEVRVEVGDRVDKGAVLAILVADRLRWEHRLSTAEVARAEAALETAHVRIDLLAQEVERLQRLSESAAFSQARYDDKLLEVAMAGSAAAEAAADLERARAKAKLSAIELARASIRAPYAGVVTQRHTEAGSYLDLGKPVVTLLDDRHLEIEADVPGSRIPGLVPGTPVTFSLGAGAAMKATVRAVVPEENPLTRTRTVRFTARFNDGLEDLAANQSVTLRLPAGKARSVITVHKDAVLIRKGKSMVFVVVEGRAEPRAVTLGEAVGGRFEVSQGLRPGDTVVVRGNERLSPGQKVHILEPAGE